jgi:aldehyde:ferredoxin oxidoreductase
MDSISVGGTVAFAIECFESGILTSLDTGGLELTWGNTEAIVQLVEKMVKREGIGDLLADGVARAARQIGGIAESYAIHAGGQELGMHDGRYDPGFAVHNVVEPTPGRHTIGSYMYYEMFQLWRVISDLPDPSLIYTKRSKYLANKEKASMAAACSQYMNVINGAGCCLFGAFMGAHRVPVFKWLNAAAGWNFSPETYLVTGHRIQTVKQLFNIKQGIDPASIHIPKRVLGEPPQKKGANRGATIPLEKLRRYYWSAMGYDTQTGIPTKDCLARLQLAAL